LKAIKLKNRRIVLLALLLFGVIGSLGVSWFLYLQKTHDTASSQIVPIRIRYGFTIHNQTNALVNQAELRVFAPVKQTSSQLCKSIEASVPFEIEEKKFGNRVLLFKFEKIAPYAGSSITVTADVDLLLSPAKMSTSELAPFLAPESAIQSDHPDIVKTSKLLKQKDIPETCRNIFNWVSRHVQYQRHFGTSRGAIYAFSRKTGDCTEFADLFTALCRASGIPARSVGGYICPQNTVLSPSEYHNWSEFYHQGQWHIADPQRKKLPEENREYIATRIIHASNDQKTPWLDKFQVSDRALSVTMN
jgi:hypothetical protein